MACECDYSYTCTECQASYDASNALDYANELRTWTVEVIKAIATKLEIEIPDPPKKRTY